MTIIGYQNIMHAKHIWSLPFLIDGIHISIFIVSHLNVNLEALKPCNRFLDVTLTSLQHSSSLSLSRWFIGKNYLGTPIHLLLIHFSGWRRYVLKSSSFKPKLWDKYFSSFLVNFVTIICVQFIPALLEISNCKSFRLWVIISCHSREIFPSKHFSFVILLSRLDKSLTHQKLLLLKIWMKYVFI